MHYDWQACFKLVQLGMHCSAAHKRLFAIIKRATGSERRLGYFTKCWLVRKEGECGHCLQFMGLFNN